MIKIRKPLNRSILIGTIAFILILCVILGITQLYSDRRMLYARYEAYIESILHYVAADIDADDLAECMRTGVESEKYRALQTLLDQFRDRLDIHFIYVIEPLNTEPKDNIRNVIAGVSKYEYENLADQLVHLNMLTGDSYSPETAGKYLRAYQSGKLSFFEEISQWGDDYTGLLPLYDSQGNRVAALCVDVDIAQIHTTLRNGIFRWLGLMLLLGAGFITLFFMWTERNVIKPIERLEASVVDFASKCKNQRDPGALVIDVPPLDTGNEVETLSKAVTQMSEAMQDYLKGMVTAENAAHAAETIAELRESVSVLFNNIPGLNFSKDAETGVYLACNQAFAEYALKSSPAEMIGLTDYEIFDPATAKHIVDNDKKALSMDTPLVFYEDVVDAAGHPRKFHTTKMKFYDSAGKMCVLGMCMDVTELDRIRTENELTKAAYQEALTTSAIYENVVDALSEDYFDQYYVDVETGDYIEYGAWTEEGKRSNERRGTDFFTQSKENARAYIYEEDLDHFMAAFDKEKLLGAIEKHGAFIFHYRLLIDGVPTYVSMKATRITGDDRHIIIGVSNVDTQVKDRMAAERAEEEKKTYMRLSALSGNLIVLYYVDPETEDYTEFSSSRGYEGYGIAKQGTDFFRSVSKNSLPMVHPEDLPLVVSQITRENVLATIERDGMFALSYRLMQGDIPTYVRFQAARVEEEGKPLLIIGVMDVDAQIRREKAYAENLSVARKMASVDSLTGIKNKHAYTQWEEKIDAKIARGEQEPFAVVVCDVNNLKAVNDLYGHKEGDAYIRKACAKICGIFSHSPVFRIGGDEFVALLSGQDYAWRRTLMEQVNAMPEDRSKARIGETIAAGIMEFDRDRHPNLLSVFEEADKAMYDRKQLMKDALSSEEVQTDTDLDNEDIPVIHVRKRILIADDVEMSRDMLGELLEDEYDILYAADGVETLEALRSHKDEIDLLLLDLQMPKMTGREVIAEMQVDEDLMSIPVVFLTVDQKAELDCLKIGAMDFIPKPYPDIEIVKARIAKCIELSEDRDLIRHTERDKLTGLLNRDYFFRYVSRLDHIYRDTALDAIVCDVNQFHALNERYGRQFCDLVLRSIGAGILKLARRTGGIGCRQGGDTFLLYCPHRDDYEELLRDFTRDVFADAETASRISLRFGVFADARQEADIEERFIRANIAAERVKDDPQRLCAFYEL